MILQSFQGTQKNRDRGGTVPSKPHQLQSQAHAFHYNMGKNDRGGDIYYKSRFHTLLISTQGNLPKMMDSIEMISSPEIQSGFHGQKNRR